MCRFPQTPKPDWWVDLDWWAITKLFVYLAAIVLVVFLLFGGH